MMMMMMMMIKMMMVMMMMMKCIFLHIFLVHLESERLSNYMANNE